MVLHNEYLDQPPAIRGGEGVERSPNRWLMLIMVKVRHQSDSDILKNLSNQESDDDDEDVIIESEEEPIDSG